MRQLQQDRPSPAEDHNPLCVDSARQIQGHHLLSHPRRDIYNDAR
jgi:hypothetical protein